MEERIDVDISIIIPLYQGQKFCGRLISMIEENYLFKNLFKECNIEVIFVNDYPQERIIIKNNKRLFNVKIINSEKNMGIHASRVKGVGYSQGKYIIMLDQDDLITKDWLYSQWNTIVSSQSNFCVCNGWKDRFRILSEEKKFKESVNNLEYYLSKENPICSPGQVIIEKKHLPREWMLNIQKSNGADDFLLWILVLKKGETFAVNNDYLYYHTPERNEYSIDLVKMIQSLKETINILCDIEILNLNEIDLLKQQIKELELIYNRSLNGNYQTKKFDIMINWMKIKNKGMDIGSFLMNCNYVNVAIYGMGNIGECLYDELSKSKVKVVYAVDRVAKDFRKELPIYKIEDKLENVDIIIITIVKDTGDIIKKLKDKVTCPVMTISEILALLRVED